jgi:hypothetical protein
MYAGGLVQGYTLEFSCVSPGGAPSEHADTESWKSRAAIRCGDGITKNRRDAKAALRFDGSTVRRCGFEGPSVRGSTGEA